jgi:hypothetical protein
VTTSRSVEVEVERLWREPHASFGGGVVVSALAVVVVDDTSRPSGPPTFMLPSFY